MPPGLVPIEGFVKNNFIINTPKLQTLRLRYASALLTLIFWVIWFYLWVPLITLGGWWFQIRFFQQEMIIVDGLGAFLNVLPVFIAVIFGLTGSLGIWALYNFNRFKGVDRRKALQPVQKQQLLNFWAISETDLNIAQSNKASTILISEDGEITVGTKRRDVARKIDSSEVTITPE